MTREQYMLQARKSRYAWAKSVDNEAVVAFNRNANERIKHGREHLRFS